MLVLAVFGAMLIVPPLVYLFNRPISHFGVPQVVIYLFAWWVVMIAGTAWLTHRLPRDPDPNDGDG